MTLAVPYSVNATLPQRRKDAEENAENTGEKLKAGKSREGLIFSAFSAASLRLCGEGFALPLPTTEPPNEHPHP